MRVGVLGPLMVWADDGEPVTVTGAKARLLLVRLLAEPGRLVSADGLVDSLWGDPDAEPPVHPYGSLQGQVSRLRAILGRAAPGGGRERLVHESGGYRLELASAELDSLRFTELLSRARAARLDAQTRAEILDEALELWRGEAYAGHAADPAVHAAARRLEEERLGALEELLDLRVRRGEQHAVLGELEQLVAAHPLRERLRAVQLRALSRAGRPADALDSYEDLRRRLAGDLGLDPGRELTDLRQAILLQEPDVDGSRPDRARRPSPPAAGPAPAPALAPAPAPAPAYGQAGGDATGMPADPGRSPYPQWSAAVAAAQPLTGPRPVAGGPLPAPLTRMVGRTLDLRTVGDLLAESRVVTVTGPGGVGKTRLAVECAGRTAARLGHEVWLTELASLPASSSSEEIARAVLRTLGVRQPDAEPDRGQDHQAPFPMAELVVGALHERRALLLLDNCEHVAGAVAELLSAVLPRIPELAVLATAQEPLGLVGEAVHPLQPLGLTEAMELFTGRAGLPPGALALPHDREAAENLCTRLDGLPLALELAAARARPLGVHGLLAGLDDRFALLSHGMRGLPERQRTLRAVIDWSWALLGPAEEAVLRRLAVHAGDASAEAAGAVCAGPDVPEPRVAEVLAKLVDRSLVVLVDRSDARRYRLLESVKAYALERLREAGEEADTRARHGTYHRSLALRAEPLLRGPRQREWLAVLDGAEADFRPAVEEALARDDVVPALRTARALTWYWLLRGRPGEAGRLLDTCLAAERTTAAGAGQRPERAAALAAAVVWRTGLALGEGTSPTTGKAELQAVLAALDEPRVVAEDPQARATALCFLAVAQMGAGDVATGEELTRRALAASEEIGDSWATAAALSVRARHALGHGDLDRARDDAERSTRLFSTLGDRWGLLQTVFPRAAMHEIAGDYPQAARLHEEGLALAEELGLWTEATKRLCALGRLAFLTGEYTEARERHVRALRLARKQNHRPGEADARIGLGMIARRTGELTDAETHMAAALAWFRAIGYGPGTALALSELGFTAELSGAPDQARELHTRALTVARDLGDVRATALALEGLAGAAAAEAAHDGAAELLGAAHAARTAVGAPLPAAERRDVDRVWSACLAALGPDAADNAFARGRTSGWEHVSSA